MPSYEQILYDVADGVATVTLNRPDKLNAWTGQMEKEVQAAMAQAEADEHVRVIVLTGAGRGFCAGADMQDLGKVAGTSSPAERERILKDRLIGPQRGDARPDFQKTYSYFPAIGKPLIGAINGSTAGLGMVIYWNDLHNSRRDCQKKKEFVRIESPPPRCDPGKKTNTPGTTAPAH